MRGMQTFRYAWNADIQVMRGMQTFRYAWNADVRVMRAWTASVRKHELRPRKEATSYDRQTLLSLHRNLACVLVISEPG